MNSYKQTQHLQKISDLILNELSICYPNLINHKKELQNHLLNNTAFHIELLNLMDEQVKNHSQFSDNNHLIAKLDTLFLEVDEEYSQQRQILVDKRKAGWERIYKEEDDEEEESILELLQDLSDDIEEEDAESIKNIFAMIDDMEEQAKHAKPIAIAFAQSHQNTLNNVLTLLDMLYPLDELMNTQLVNDDYITQYSQKDFFPIRYGLRIGNESYDDESLLLQAERIYQKILALPDTYHVIDEFGFVNKGKQAVQGQFWFVALINAVNSQFIDDNNLQTNLTSWLLDTLHNAPEKLFMFSYELTGIPSFWWKNLAKRSAEIKEKLNDKKDPSLRVALNHLNHQQDVDAKMTAVYFNEVDNIDIIPLEEVGFSDDQNELIIALNQFTELLKKHFPDLKILNKTNINISAIEKALSPLSFSEDIRVFYHWSLQFANIEAFFYFPSIDNLANSYRFNLEILQDSVNLWSKVLFSFAYESQVHLITPLSEQPTTQQMIYFLEIVDGDLEGYFDSVLAMIKTYMEAYESDIFTTEYGNLSIKDDDNWTENDYEENERIWTKIRLKHNPNAYYSDLDNVIGDCNDDLSDVSSSNINNTTDQDVQSDTTHQNKKHVQNYIEYWDVNNWPKEWQKYQVGEVNDDF